MNVEKLLNSNAAMAAVGILAAGAVLYFFIRKAGGAVGEVVGRVGTAINPASDQNLVNRGVSAVGSALTGDKSWSLGSWLYDRFNPPYDPNADYVPRKLAVREAARVYTVLPFTD